MIVEWEYRPTRGLACNNRADPLVFDLCPVLEQVEMFGLDRGSVPSHIDSVVSVSGLVEGEESLTRRPAANNILKGFLNAVHFLHGLARHRSDKGRTR